MRTVLVCLALAFVLAACGGDDDTPDPTGTTSAATVEATSTAAFATDLPATVDGQSTAPSPTDDAGEATSAPSLLSVELSDFTITPSVASMPAGEVQVTVNNTGQGFHNLLFIKTDFAADALPTDEDGAVDEVADGLDVVDEVFELASGEGDEIVTDLPAGEYVLVCNIVDEDGIHYQRGMRVAFTVQ